MSSGPRTEPPAGRAVAGLLLTGGKSTRLGRDKAALPVDGEPLAVRVAGRLAAVASPALEVGPGRSGLLVAGEHDPGEGPLPAIAAGWAALGRLGFRGPVLVVATDLPALTVELLAWLAGHPGDASVVPVVAGMPQLLCARWSPADLDRVASLRESGERAVRRALGDDAVLAGEDEWGAVASAECFADIDEPADLERLRDD